MKNIWRNSLYHGKNIIRDTSFSFWVLAYPIILASFFYMALSGITNVELESINIGVEKENPVVFVLEDIDILNLIEIEEKNANENLNSGAIDGYVMEDLNLLVNKSGLDQTIIKSILDQIKQTIALNEPMENLDFEVDYLMGKNQNAIGILVIFYSLIAMVSTYGVFPGIEAAVMIQPNLSNVGARVSITPIKKSTLLTSSLIVGFFVNMLSNILLLLFLTFVLKLDLLTNIFYSFIFILLGNIFGISLGLFIGSSNKKSSGFKVMLSIMITLSLSFLSGMMSVDMKILIDKNVPILGKINPISIITNSLYRINLLENTSNLSQGIILLIIYSSILMAGSYVFLRRNQYDSI